MVTKADVDMLPTGTGPFQLVQLDANSKLPAVDASNLTNVAAALSLDLDDLTDVIITTPASGHVLYHNGAAFVNAAPGATSGVQAYDAQLADIAGLTPTDNGVIIGNGTNFVVESGATLKTSLGLTIGTDVQAWDNDLDDIAALSHTSGNVIRSNGTDWQSFALSLTNITAPTTDYSFGSFRLTSLGTPTQASDAVTKAYVDAAVTSIHAHASVKAATTATLTATYTPGTTGADGGTGVGATLTNSGAQAALVIDTYSTIVGDRILVKNQSTQTQNGIYVVTDIGSVSTNWILTRATDSDNGVIATELSPGDFVFVSSGSVNISTGWVESGSGAVVIDTTNVTYTQFSGAGTYIAGTGLDLVGNEFSLEDVGTPGTYKSVTTNAKGQVTAGTNPTTLAGYGITDAQPIDSDLTSIAALTHTANNVIKSNGTVWESGSIALDNLSDVIITSPAIDQTLAYNGTNWVNGAGSGGTLEKYFNAGNSINDRTDLTAATLTNAYQYSGTGRAVVTSIHVTNRDGTAEYEADIVMNNGTTDYYVGKLIPIPANTSLEMLKRPKVLLPNERLKFKANTASKLQVIATIAPYDSNTKLFNAYMSVNGTTEQTVYTESNASGSVIESITLANDDSGTNGVQVTLVMNDGTNNTYLAYTVNIPQKSSVEICEGPKFLANTGTIKVTASDIDRVDIIVSGRKL